jgi:hypothetical protein
MRHVVGNVHSFVVTAFVSIGMWHVNCLYVRCLAVNNLHASVFIIVGTSQFARQILSHG